MDQSQPRLAAAWANLVAASAATAASLQPGHTAAAVAMLASAAAAMFAAVAAAIASHATQTRFWKEGLVPLALPDHPAASLRPGLGENIATVGHGYWCDCVCT